MNTDDAASPTARLEPSRLARLRSRLPKRFRVLGPGMALYLVSPIVAELCIGATPWFSYIFFGWMLSLMYGGGAILIREAAVRWNKGWPTILTLGIAYAIAEEGVAVRTFFDRTAPALQPIGDFGWAGGVNWVWSINLSIYHAVFSIAIPIFLVMLAYPRRRTEPWVSSRWLKKATVGYVGVIAFWLVVYKRPVDGGYIVASLAAIALLVWIARLLPRDLRLPFAALPGRVPAQDGPRAPTPRRVAIVAFAATFWVFAFQIFRGIGTSMLVSSIAMPVIAGVAGWWFVRGSRRAGWSDRHRYAIAAGIFAFSPAFSVLMELAGLRGQLIVGIVTAYLIRRTWRRVREREAETGDPRTGDVAAAA
jgi:hypothetical protein